MSTAPFQQTNFTTQDPATYKGGIDANFAVLSRLGARFAPHAQTVPNMTIAVDAGSIFNGGALAEVAAQNTAPIPAPVSNPRIDRIVVDNAGVVSVVTGAEAAAPVPPGIPAGRMPVARVLLAVGATAITNTMITDERTAGGGSGFSTAVAVPAAATVDLGTIATHNAVVSGTGTITSFGANASLAAPLYFIEFSGACRITNGASIMCPGNMDLSAQPGDSGLLEYLGSGTWRFRSFRRAKGNAPTRQILTTGDTYHRPDNCTAIFYRFTGGGGGGAGYGAGYNGSDGGITTFGTITAMGGKGGQAGNLGTPGLGGTGGTGADYYQQGGTGSQAVAAGSPGGSTILGPGAGTNGTTGQNAQDGTGGGGGGGGSNNTGAIGSGPGGGGEGAEGWIYNPAAFYPIQIGAGGAGGTGTISPGGKGGKARIVVDEYYV